MSRISLQELFDITGWDNVADAFAVAEDSGFPPEEILTEEAQREAEDLQAKLDG